MAESHDTFRDRSGRRWVNRSVVSLMKHRAAGNETPPETIRRLAREMVAGAKSQGWEGLPFDVEILAGLQGIDVKPADGDIKAEARLMPLPDQRLEIEYAPEALETRRRFSICHEIAHTFFPDCFTQIQHRRKGAPFDPVHAELEQLCHLGASELLLPVEEFLENAAGRGPGMRAAEELGQVFNASVEASLRRLVDLSEDACCLYWLSERLKPKEERQEGPEFDFGLPGPKPKLRVDYHVPSQSWKGFIPKHKSIPDESGLYKILKGEGFEGAQENWGALNLGRVHVEGMVSIHAGEDVPALMVLIKPT